jgi:predicted outer membrane lipoprotein
MDLFYIFCWIVGLSLATVFAMIIYLWWCTRPYNDKEDDEYWFEPERNDDDTQ